jgi:hypothetical protein
MSNLYPKVPAAFVAASSTVSEKKRKTEAAPEKVEAKPVKTEARINMSDDVAGKGRCPECNKPMIQAFANGHPVYVCNQHRIAIPLAD